MSQVQGSKLSNFRDWVAGDSEAVRNSFYKALVAHLNGPGVGIDEDRKAELLKRLEHEILAPALGKSRFRGGRCACASPPARRLRTKPTSPGS